MRVLVGSMMLSLTLLAANAHAAISTERQYLYKAIMAQPNNLTLNQQYANLCITENDFEAAIPALERLAILQPSNALLRLRLGEMFKALGSEMMAHKYFTEAATHPNANSDVKLKAQGYLQ